MKALIIVHEPGQTAARVGVRLRQRGVQTIDTVVSSEAGGGIGSLRADPPEDFDLIVSLGSQWNVHRTEPISSWIHDELDYLRAADAAGVPVFGVCFGAQALAAALGGSVAPSSAPQIGWYSPRTALGALEGPWFEWHSDCFVAPPGAEILAVDDVATQAFSLRRNVGVQFHPEIDHDHLRWWLELGGDSNLVQAGIDVAALVAQTRELERDAHRRCDGLVDWVLETVVPGGDRRRQPHQPD